MGWEKEKRGRGAGLEEASKQRREKTDGQEAKKIPSSLRTDGKKEKRRRRRVGKLPTRKKGKRRKKNRRNWAAINHRCEERIFFPVLICLAGSVQCAQHL